jgi:hypothetical protein
MELTAENVVETLKSCLFEGEPDLAKAVLVEGVVAKFGFDPERLKAREAEIISMLEQLPPQFRAEVGGGYSFLGACQRADGVQWGEHRTVDELFCLGLAIGRVKLCLPRDMWPALPGGMPYYVVE